MRVPVCHNAFHLVNHFLKEYAGMNKLLSARGSKFRRHCAVAIRELVSSHDSLASLAKLLGVSPQRLSYSVQQGRVSKNLAILIDEKVGFPFTKAYMRPDIHF